MLITDELDYVVFFILKKSSFYINANSNLNAIIKDV